jgi:hypothetical protein
MEVEDNNKGKKEQIGEKEIREKELTKKHYLNDCVNT